MKHLDNALQLARQRLGGSVVALNPTAREEWGGKNPAPLFFGVKNTAGIPAALFDTLRSHPDFLWLTVDKMAHLGRSVDVELTNPLTYRHMTGSTSGGCVNILLGINDLCIGTDGGGSVLAPALSTQLFSFMGKGCGLMVQGESRSTDGLDFVGGVGIIAATLSAVKRASQLLCGADVTAHDGGRTRVVIPAPHCMPLPGGGDANARLRAVLPVLSDRFDFEEYAFSNPYDRHGMVADLRALEARGAQLVLTFEGPVDVFGYDETIPRAFGGAAPDAVTGAACKGLVKAVNICNWSGFTVPSGELAAGFVIAAAPGRPAAARGFALADALAAHCARPDMFERFFVRCEKCVPPFTTGD